MIDADDVGDGFLYGGVIVGLIFLVIYIVFSRPEISKCEQAGGVIVKSNGNDVCIDKSALIDRNKKAHAHAGDSEMTPSQSPAHPLAELDAHDEKTMEMLRAFEDAVYTEGRAYEAGCDCEALQRLELQSTERRKSLLAHLAFRPGRAEPTELMERLHTSRKMIGDMAADGRGPRMSVPADRERDEDLFICDSLDLAIAALSQGAKK